MKSMAKALKWHLGDSWHGKAWRESDKRKLKVAGEKKMKASAASSKDENEKAWHETGVAIWRNQRGRNRKASAAKISEHQQRGSGASKAYPKAANK
jgi:hypothetical protein